MKKKKTVDKALRWAVLSKAIDFIQHLLALRVQQIRIAFSKQETWEQEIWTSQSSDQIQLNTTQPAKNCDSPLKLFEQLQESCRSRSRSAGHWIENGVANSKHWSVTLCKIVQHSETVTDWPSIWYLMVSECSNWPHPAGWIETRRVSRPLEAAKKF